MIFSFFFLEEKYEEMWGKYKVKVIVFILCRLKKKKKKRMISDIGFIKI